VTYTELVALLQDYLENSEDGFVANIPQIVQQAEARIYNACRTVDSRKTVTDVVSTNTIVPPEDFIEPLYLMVNGTMMMQRQKSYLRTVWGDTTGTPSDYCLDYTTLYSGASTIFIAPVPTVEVSYELSYAGAPYSIVDQEVTYVSNNFPEALLYGCLVEGYAYNKGEQDMMAVYQGRFDSALALLIKSAEKLQLTDEYRNPPERIQ